MSIIYVTVGGVDVELRWNESSMIRWFRGNFGFANAPIYLLGCGKE